MRYNRSRSQVGKARCAAIESGDDMVVVQSARSDHRVEKMVDSAPGSGGRFAPPDAELGSRPPEPLTYTPDS
jgi:hypothetical protein